MPPLFTRLAAALLTLAGFAANAGHASATCVAIAERSPLFTPAAFRTAQTATDRKVGIAFLGHASFLIESPKGVRIVTDFTDYVAAPGVPDVVTMNNAHDSHFSYAPDARIPHALPGWGLDGLVRHDVTVKDVRVRNVPTNLRPLPDGGWANGNSIFVYEVSGLCIAHIGHLHHVMSEQQEYALGRVDVLLIAIDGMWTMSHIELEDTLERLEAPLVIPMHFGSAGSRQSFVAIAQKLGYRIELAESPAIQVELGKLPRDKVVRFLPGY